MPKNNDDNRFKLNGGSRKEILLIVGLVLLFLIVVFSSSPSKRIEEISYSQFLTEIQSGNIEDVVIIEMQEIRGNRYDLNNLPVRFFTIIPYFDESLLAFLEESGVTVKGEARGVSIGLMLLQFLPTVVIIGMIIWMYRNVQGVGKRTMSFGRSRAKRYDSSGENLNFNDVAGQKEAKYELQEVVAFLQNPENFTRLGAKIPKGVLLIGEPGTGKTLLAKAVAGEASVPFFHMSGSDFVEMFVGVGAGRVRDLFEQGRKNAPCILFIDEIDAVGRRRGAGYGGGHDEREQTLNQLLVEMDGFDTNRGVIIIAATNRSDVLDPALLRPGRFDRQVVVSMPDVKEREAILKIHASKLLVSSNVDFSIMAKATVGSSGADIANIVNEAALFAGRTGRKKVTMVDFEEACDKILLGIARKSMAMTQEEKQMTAYHEAGHTLLHYVQSQADPVHKVTIIPRGQALGITYSLPEKERYSRSVGWLKARLVVMYGGYAAEEMVYKETSTGAQMDIRHATDLARKMVCEWGMSILGPVAMGNSDEPIFIGKKTAQHADYSDGTAQQIDKEIRFLLNEALEKARDLLRRERTKLESLTTALMERETLNDAEIRALWNMEPAKTGVG